MILIQKIQVKYLICGLGGKGKFQLQADVAGVLSQRTRLSLLGLNMNNASFRIHKPASDSHLIINKKKTTAI